MIGRSMVPAGKSNGNDPFIVELANEKPTKLEDRDKVSTYFIDPMLAEFQKVSSAEELAHSWTSFLRIELAGYSADVLRTAALHFKRNGWTDDPRSKGFMPPTELILKKIRALHRDSPEGRRERALDLMHKLEITPYRDAPDIWRGNYDYPNDLGPFVGKEGCVLTVVEQSGLWRAWLGIAMAKNPSVPLAYNVHGWGVDVSAPDCGIPQDVLDEFGLRATRADLDAMIAAQDALQKANAKARREREEAEREAAAKRYNQERARKRAEEQAFQHKLNREPTLRNAEMSWHSTMHSNYRTDVPATPLPTGLGPWSWPSHYGPLPGQPGCLVTPDLQERYGFTPHESTLEYWRLRLAHHERDPQRRDVNWYADTGKDPDCRDVLERATEIVDGVRVLKPLALPSFCGDDSSGGALGTRTSETAR